MFYTDISQYSFNEVFIMYYDKEFFGYSGYSFFFHIGVLSMILINLFNYKAKKTARSLFSENIIYVASTVDKRLVPVAKNLTFIVEMIFLGFVSFFTTQFNGAFGSAFETGGNYFGLLGVTPIFITIYSVVLFINPVKQLDIFTMCMPVFLFFVKFACFLTGCCWGIPWEHGMYNAHPYHHGNQVPVQLIEAVLGLVILVFLLLYKKRAKPGTMYPMYLIVYCVTRFFSEFTKADYPNVLGPLKMYHLLCIAGVFVGLLLFVVLRLYGESIYTFFEKPHINLEVKIRQREENMIASAIEQKQAEEAAEKKRLEKIRLAREKAKSRKK